MTEERTEYQHGGPGEWKTTPEDRHTIAGNPPYPEEFDVTVGNPSYSHGGPRPAVREDDRRLAPFRDGPRPGAGKPMRNHTLSVGASYYVVRHTPDGDDAGEVWTVAAVSRNRITFSVAGGPDTVTFVK